MAKKSMKNDSLIVTESQDGGLEVSWDEKDPKYAWMNDLTEEEVHTIIKQALAEAIQDE
jgi:hypothetical protein